MKNELQKFQQQNIMSFQGIQDNESFQYQNFKIYFKTCCTHLRNLQSYKRKSGNMYVFHAFPNVGVYVD